MKKNNKGFSLVELIIVIAIMAVLMAVLAPQFLRYVERSRLQSDNTAIGEIANACKIAAADETISGDIAGTAGGATVTIPVGAANAGDVTANVASLQTELQATIGEMALNSNTYIDDAGAGATNMAVINVQVVNGVTVVSSTVYVEEVDGAAVIDGDVNGDGTDDAHIF